MNHECGYACRARYYGPVDYPVWMTWEQWVEHVNGLDTAFDGQRINKHGVFRKLDELLVFGKEGRRGECRVKLVSFKGEWICETEKDVNYGHSSSPCTVCSERFGSREAALSAGIEDVKTYLHDKIERRDTSDATRRFAREILADVREYELNQKQGSLF